MIELHLPAPPTNLSTNHRRRSHWNDVNELTERAKLLYGTLIKNQLGKNYQTFNYAKITFTLVVPNFKVSDPDNISGMTKPILDAITERSGIIGIIPDDSGKFVEVHYRVARSKDKRPAWLLMQIEEAEPVVVDIQPEGIKNVGW